MKKIRRVGSALQILKMNKILQLTTINEHPEDILGTLEKTNTAYGFDLTYTPKETRTFEEMLGESVQALPQIFAERNRIAVTATNR